MGARYSRQSGYTIAKRQTAQRSTVRTVQRRVKFGPTAAKYFGLGVLAILAIVMLAQSSTNATNAYKQTDLRKQIGQTSQDIERLKLEVDRAKTLQEVQKTAVKDQLEQTKQTDMVEVGDVAGVSTEAPKQP